MSRFLLALCLAVFAIACRAADRPYIVANSGAAEEDEEQVWAVENWVRQAGHQKSFTIAPEYAFSPDNSLQAEFRRVLDRDRGNGHEIEIEFKHLFNRIAREGWGWGVVLALDMERPEGGPWTHAATSLSLPLTLQLDEASKSLVHLNLGVSKPKEERRVFTGVIAAEREVWRRTSLFAEAARDREGRLLHAGVRHWIKRERLAFDIAWQRVRSDELRGSGIVLGLAWYDL
ncbi:MAG: hypothetical protein JSR38_05100 [Proteobacteria bacterium]|nr:hypothetical protein [Pseudomonadota bacterium]